MQHRITLLLLLAVALASALTASSVAWLANHQLAEEGQARMAYLHSQLRERFHAFDLLLAEEEVELDERLEDRLPRIDAALRAWSADPLSTSAEDLGRLAQRFGVEHLYVIDSDGVVVATNYAPDLGLDLSRAGEGMRRMLFRLRGSGEVFSDRFNISVATGRLRKYAYFGPADAAYVLEASLDLHAYIAARHSERYLDYLFNGLFRVPTQMNSQVVSLDTFLANGFGAWSLGGTGETLPPDVVEAFETTDRDVFIQRQGDLTRRYERYTRVGASGGETEDLVTRVVYDDSAQRRLLQSTVLLAGVAVLVFGALAFWTSRWLFSRHLIRPVNRIAEGLAGLARGRFGTLEPTGVRELDVITRGINQLQGRITRREQALREANEHLEARVRARTAELEQANRELQTLATCDGLTGLANRRHFLGEAERAWRRAQRTGEPLAIAVLDLDLFKDTNDRYGHAAGDAVLCALAACLGRTLRETDLAGRLGGEEFGLLLVDTDLDGAQTLLERLRERIASTPVGFEGRSLSLSASIGVARCRQADRGIAEALSRADRALYVAKREGRNRVRVDRG
ncbi:diguanylate cyclase [Guyparkeria halophila]|uniref:diguanylate cyclase n=1 Tax=Guyparkeria halophila TaxID=47960 RepID=A0ABZ0YZ44_9GAMM|nr:diguanylate cyclase [Guyparkeria halophila]WQH16547.1 diguanylate cyclase [Guyparkeria halophila]